MEAWPRVEGTCALVHLCACASLHLCTFAPLQAGAHRKAARIRDHGARRRRRERAPPYRATGGSVVLFRGWALNGATTRGASARGKQRRRRRTVWR